LLKAGAPPRFRAERSVARVSLKEGIRRIRERMRVARERDRVRGDAITNLAERA